jgi:hypothetical protein
MVAASVAEADFPLALRARRPDEVDLAEVSHSASPKPPVRELKGFRRVAVDAGVSVTADFTLGLGELIPEAPPPATGCRTPARRTSASAAASAVELTTTFIVIT